MLQMMRQQQCGLCSSPCRILAGALLDCSLHPQSWHSSSWATRSRRWRLVHDIPESSSINISLRPSYVETILLSTLGRHTWTWIGERIAEQLDTMIFSQCKCFSYSVLREIAIINFQVVNLNLVTTSMCLSAFQQWWGAVFGSQVKLKGSDIIRLSNISFVNMIPTTTIYHSFFLSSSFLCTS